MRPVLTGQSTGRTDPAYHQSMQVSSTSWHDEYIRERGRARNYSLHTQVSFQHFVCLQLLITPYELVVRFGWVRNRIGNTKKSSQETLVTATTTTFVTETDDSLSLRHKHNPQRSVFGKVPSSKSLISLHHTPKPNYHIQAYQVCV